jgi:S1-C subfamily serine protease
LLQDRDFKEFSMASLFERLTALSPRLMLVALCLGASGVHPATVPPPGPQAAIEALNRANAAVVGVQVTVAEGARSAQTLGRQRSGSGVVIGDDGLILTIGYLMLEAQNIQIVTSESQTLPARALAYDQATGFGLIKALLPMRGVLPVQLGSLNDSSPGDALIAATGTQWDGALAEVNMTHMVSKRAFSGYWEYHIDSAGFTSPPIRNHSGAGLFNQFGQLIGIGSLYVTNAMGGSRQLPGNMFVPVDLLKPILAEMQRTGSTTKSHRPWLGLSSVEQGGRIQVIRVNKDSPAQAAGLAPGDLVLAIDGVKVDTLEAFYKKLWSYGEPNAEVRLTVLQGADIKTITLKAVDRMSTMTKPEGI